ncbi:MAG: T9SS type A sorting domain-containing protein [Flavobacteriales bacterium]|nr:T9SS type A sorting domain-containing protein [Flavobacteriales bacterium]
MKKYLITLLTLALWSVVDAQGINYVVTSTSDDPNDGSGTSGSFRYCVNQANLSPGRDNIQFHPSTDGVEIIFDSTVYAHEPFNIVGRGKGKTILKASASEQLIFDIYNTVPGIFEFSNTSFKSTTVNYSFGFVQDQGTAGDVIYVHDCDFYDMDQSIFLDDAVAQNTCVIERCDFYNCNVGVVCQNLKESMTVNNCTFNASILGDMYIISNNFYVKNNLSFDGQSGGYGGIIIVDPPAPATGDYIVTNNTVYNNGSAGVYIDEQNGNAGAIIFANNIFYGNNVDYLQQTGSNSPMFLNNIGSSSTGSTVVPSWTFSVDPLLDANYYPSAGSVAIDAAEATYATNRGLDGYLAQGTRDIGANEYRGCAGFSASLAVDQDVTCYGGADGQVTVTVSGGTTPYAYQWDGQQQVQSNVNSQLSATTAGTVLITDANNCDITLNYSLTEPAEMSLDINEIIKTDHSCSTVGSIVFGANAVINPVGTLTYYVRNSAGNATNNATGTFSGMAPDVYTVQVVNDLGCKTTTENIEVLNAASEPVIALVETPVTCSGNSDGVITANVTGGTPNYSYSWNAAAGNTSNIQNGLSENVNVVCTVTDANGCSASSSLTTATVSGMTLTSVVTDETCGSANGAIDLTVTGGTAPYQYGWSVQGASIQDLTGISAGYYQVTVLDANSCQAQTEIKVNATDFTISGSPFSPSCEGAQDGGVDITITPSGTYTYHWSDVNGSDTEDLANVGRGIYNVKVTDPSGCVVTEVFEVLGASNPLSSGIAVTLASGCNASDAVVDVSSLDNTYTYTLTQIVDSEWEFVGNSGFTSGNCISPNIELTSGGTPVVSYAKLSGSGKSTAEFFNGSSWSYVGQQEFTPGVALYADLKLDGADLPIIAFRDFKNGYKSTVMKFDGSDWIILGSAGFSTGKVLFPSLIVNGSDNPVITVLETNNNLKAAVYEFDGTTWQQIGLLGNGAGTEDCNAVIQKDASGNYFVAFTEGATGDKITVMKYNGSSWTIVGSAGFTAGAAHQLRMEVDAAGNPIVSFKDATVNNKLTVMKFDGSSWSILGSSGVSGINPYTSVLKLDNADNPYLAFNDASNGNKATVIRYNGSSWNTVGGAGFTDGASWNLDMAIDANANPIIAFQDESKANKMSVLRYVSSNLGTGQIWSGLESGSYKLEATNGTCTYDMILEVGATGGLNISTNTIKEPSSCSTASADGVLEATMSGTGTAPYTYVWRKFENGSVTEVSNIRKPNQLTPGEYFVEVTDANGCVGVGNGILTTKPLVNTEICKVSVEYDQVTGQQYNELIWDKTPFVGMGVTDFIVARKKNSGDMEPIAVVPMSSLSILNDYGVDPDNANNTYMLFAITSCDDHGMFPIAIKNQRTIQLAFDNLVSASGVGATDGSLDLYWNAYVGIDGITDYQVTRTLVVNGTTTEYENVIGTVSVSNPTPSGTNRYYYHDNTVPFLDGNTSVFYTIKCAVPSPCEPTKAQDYGSTRSNKATISNAGGLPVDPSSEVEEIENEFSLYPNPVADVLNIISMTEEQYEVVIKDINGRTVSASNEFGNASLNVGGMSSGIYLIEIHRNEQVVEKIKFIKN